MKYLFCSLCLVLITFSAISQGCSDAGFCSLSILKNRQASHTQKNNLGIGIGYGLGDEQTNTINPYLTYTRKFSAQFSAQVKLTAVSASGFLGSNFNVGDVFVSGIYAPKLKNTKNQLGIIGGFKIPLTVANDKNKNGLPLPLDYQSSIGTFDAIIGVNYIINNKIEINGGLQLPLVQSNKNSFFPEEYTDPRAKTFAPTNNFKRKADVLVRLGYYLPVGTSAITIKPNLLAIYHTGNDTYVNKLGQTTTLNNSTGLTLNAGINATKDFKNKHQLELVLATPIVARTIRPDGLTRKAVINLEYKIPF